METTERKIEFCRSCRAPIVWLRHATSGKPAPIDRDPAPDGNILTDPRGGTYRIIEARERATFAGALHKNHFATCGQAKQWSRK